ncbi:formylglycine-generating enzyme family protein [Ramlibacter sp. GTP1]|uniref:Formylglycine-generating enzyme family protein n=2 Tax=Ramlibacter albus TaxID=2079448 RepID=A0A923S3T1_9BURK|nr:formylglycine-generating enzyme family protein [Ramlibacter albus]
MRWIPGGRFRMGCENFYPEEAPVRTVGVDGFWIDEVPVTNAMFKRFVDSTGYVTLAEEPLDPAAYAGVDPALLQPGSLVFVSPRQRVRLDDISQWWQWRVGADWRHPLGSGSSLAGLEDHPVVHVTHRDAAAYAAWAGKALPTEAEWERACRGGHEDRDYAWGDELAPGGRMLANYFQGQFPWNNTCEDGYERTSPVRSYPSNDYGLFDMIGNVWEWTDDWFVPATMLAKKAPGCGCAPQNPRGGSQADSTDPRDASTRLGRRVCKGGSHLCAVGYCQRYRPASRHAQAIDSSTSHIGFRCVVRA